MNPREGLQAPSGSNEAAAEEAMKIIASNIAVLESNIADTKQKMEQESNEAHKEAFLKDIQETYKRIAELRELMNECKADYVRMGTARHGGTTMIQ